MYLPDLDGISFTKEAKQDFHFSPNTSDHFYSSNLLMSDIQLSLTF